MKPGLKETIQPRKAWEAERAAYLERMTPWVERRRGRRSRGLKHPVEDFLWEYYALRGGRLLSWSPGIGVVLDEADEARFPERDGYIAVESGRRLDHEALIQKRRDGLRWIRNLLIQTRDRPPMFGCLGLHEWAMVYEEEDIRHPQVPLRLAHADTRAVVESMPLQCTHFDAFRFFSSSARPLNRQRLTAEDRPSREQPGCLHANMDLFKWCMKLQPLVPSALTLRAFDLCCRLRLLDMRASPYDLRDFGLDPVRIETPEGRRDYVAAQKAFAEEAAPLRGDCIRMLDECLSHDL